MSHLTRYGDDHPGRFEWIDANEGDTTSIYVKDRVCGGTLYIRKSYDWLTLVHEWMARQPVVELENAA